MEFSSSPAFEGRKIFYLDVVKIFFEIIREKIRRIKSFPRNIFLKQLPLPPLNSLLIFSFKDTQREREEGFRYKRSWKIPGKRAEKGQCLRIRYNTFFFRRFTRWPNILRTAEGCQRAERERKRERLSSRFCGRSTRRTRCSAGCARSKQPRVVSCRGFGA